MYCPIILDSDKTTVSVATGQVEYHPLYLSIGNPHNTIWRVHRNAVIPIAFLAIPKGRLHQTYSQKAEKQFPGDRDSDNKTGFHVFKHQLYRTSVKAVLRTLCPGRETPVVR